MQRWFDEKDEEREIAYVMINCESGAEPQVMEELGSIDGIKEIAYTFGCHDIVTRIEASSVELLREIITLGIRKLDGVRSTTTLICKETILPMQRIIF
jgi:DNA-binding Lrp family transcriptional regulator